MKKRFSVLSRLKKVDHPPVLTVMGFSLVELLVALCVMSIFSAAVFRLFVSVSRSYTTQNVTSGTQQNVRAALDFMARDIRLAGLDPLRTAGAGIVAASATSLRFTVDRNFDGDLNDVSEDITYDVTGGNLQLTDDIGTETLTDNVNNISFTYFDQDGAVTATVGDIRSVEISLTLQEPAGRGRPVLRRYTTRVRCRNIGL
jgi:prepilin-type N-terminal cleavage/methylation domain-containing protein